MRYGDGSRVFLWRHDGRWFVVGFTLALNGAVACDSIGRLPHTAGGGVQMATRGVVPFGEQSWEQEAEGVRALVCQVDGARWAIVEYAPGSGVRSSARSATRAT